MDSYSVIKYSQCVPVKNLIHSNRAFTINSLFECTYKYEINEMCVCMCACVCVCVCVCLCACACACVRVIKHSYTEIFIAALYNAGI